MRRWLALLWLVLWPWLLVLALAGMALGIALSVSGCATRGDQTRAELERATVVAVAVAGDAAIRIVAAAEREEGLAAIEASSSLEDARARLVAIYDRWTPVWGGLDALALMQDLAAEAVEEGAPPNLPGLVRAYCAVRAMVRPRAELPTFPLLGVRCEP